MSDLINRQDAIDKFKPWLKIKGYSEGELNMLKAVLYELTFMPSAQPDQKKGRWGYIDTGTMRKACSICGQIMPPLAPVKDQTGVPRYEWRYCPACGSLMRR